MQRYYSPNLGRFYSPDPGGIATANPRNPSTWNRYSYVSGDPVNSIDRHGLYTDDIDCLSNPDAPECTNPCAPMSEMMSLRRGMAMMLGAESGCGPIALPDGGGDEAEEDSTAPPIPIYCETDVIAAMKTSWSQTSNGIKGIEAGFRVRRRSLAR